MNLCAHKSKKTGLNDVRKREQTIFHVYNYNANISNMQNGYHNNKSVWIPKYTLTICKNFQNDLFKFSFTGNSQHEYIKTSKFISFILLFTCSENDLNLFRTIHYCLLSFSFFILFPIYSRYSLLISDSPELLQFCSS